MSTGSGIAIASIWTGISVAIVITGNAEIAPAYGFAFLATIAIVLFS